MTNDEFHAKLDALAAETYQDIRKAHTPGQCQRAIRDALEEAVKFDHELHYQRENADG
jgi:hypothetical protein